jgi:hypothetical protein
MILRIQFTGCDLMQPQLITILLKEIR